MGEFELIKRYFTTPEWQQISAPQVSLGVGDDCAIVAAKDSASLAISVDTLVSGVHFPESSAAADVGYKALMVNLSDLAAMGAEPAWFTLALTLPSSDEVWLQEFSQGLLQAAKASACPLIGGDTTKGPVLTVTIQIAGVVGTADHADNIPSALLRSGAQVGDLIYVSGYPGEAAAGLQNYFQNQQLDMDDPLQKRLQRPSARLELGQLLRKLVIANSCIDVSDGLLADLGHICNASGVGAEIQLSTLAPSLHLSKQSELSDSWRFMLTGGDDYELCFTVSSSKQEKVAEISALLDLPLTAIGRLTSSPGIKCLDADGNEWLPEAMGYDHFKTSKNNNNSISNNKKVETDA